MLLAIWTVASCVGVSNGAYPKVTASDVKKLRAEFREIVDESTLDPLPDPFETGFTGIQPLLASTVRLAFHDCMGRTATKGKGAINTCDGCFDFASPANAGLEENAFDSLEALYRGSKSKWFKKMSRADFWMAAATISVEIAAENAFTTWPDSFVGRGIIGQQFPAPLRDIPFYFGRRDCKTSPDAKEEGVFDFPNDQGAFDETVAWFENVFGFDAAETVTILGAHTLGGGHINDAGYIGQWTGFSHVLNNDYYGQMAANPPNINANSFKQDRVRDLLLCTPQNDCGDDDTLFQWFFDGPSDVIGPLTGLGFYLNVDIALALRIDDHLNASNGQVSCTAPTFEELIGGFVLPTRCPYQSTSGLVDAYANDNSLFIDAFADVFEKMITVNEDEAKLQRLVVEYDRSFEWDVPVTTTQPIPIPPSSIDAAGTLRQMQSTLATESEAEPALDAVPAVVGSVAFVGVMAVICAVYRRRKVNVLSKQINDATALIE